MGIFDGKVDLFNYYCAELQFRDRIMGPIPKDPQVIEGWLRKNLGVTGEAEVKAKLQRTLVELGHPVDENMTMEQLIEATQEMAKDETNGFKSDDGGLYIEGRAVKAMLKECVNILYADTRFGPNRKGAKAFTAERVFVAEDRIHFGVKEPSGIEVMFGRVQTPQGPRSTVGYHEYVERPTIRFHFMESKLINQKRDKDDPTSGAPPCLTEEQWHHIWVLAQEIGLGALRSQSHGRFDITAWDAVKREDVPRPGADALEAGAKLQEAQEAAG